MDLVEVQDSSHVVEAEILQRWKKSSHYYTNLKKSNHIIRLKVVKVRRAINGKRILYMKFQFVKYYKT